MYFPERRHAEINVAMQVRRSVMQGWQLFAENGKPGSDWGDDATEAARDHVCRQYYRRVVEVCFRSSVSLLVWGGGLPDHRRENKSGIREPVITAGSSAPGLGAMIKQAGEHYEWDGPQVLIGGVGYTFCV